MNVIKRAEITVADIDQDGQLDLLFNGNRKIDWWRKTATQPVRFQRYPIEKPDHVAPLGMGIEAIDLDGDGDIDVMMNQK